jgi:hypothetical protein
MPSVKVYFNGPKLMSALNYAFVCPLANLANRPVFSEQANLLVIMGMGGMQEAELISYHINCTK